MMGILQPKGYAAALTMSLMSQSSPRLRGDMLTLPSSLPCVGTLPLPHIKRSPGLQHCKGANPFAEVDFVQMLAPCTDLAAPRRAMMCTGPDDASRLLGAQRA